MKRPSILDGVFVAAALAVGSFPLLWGFSAVLTFPAAVRTTLVAAQLGYAAYLLRRRGGGVGTPTLAAANLVWAVLVWWASWSLSGTAGALAGACWLTRSLLFQRSPAAAGLDGALAVAGVAFAGKFWDPHNGTATALWAFFLVQSAWVLIPSRGFPREADAAVDPFAASRRQAETALERLGSGLE